MRGYTLKSSTMKTDSIDESTNGAGTRIPHQITLFRGFRGEGSDTVRKSVSAGISHVSSTTDILVGSCTVPPYYVTGTVVRVNTWQTPHNSAGSNISIRVNESEAVTHLSTTVNRPAYYHDDVACKGGDVIAVYVRSAGSVSAGFTSVSADDTTVITLLGEAWT